MKVPFYINSCELVVIKRVSKILFYAVIATRFVVMVLNNCRDIARR